MLYLFPMLYYRQFEMIPKMIISSGFVNSAQKPSTILYKKFRIFYKSSGD